MAPAKVGVVGAEPQDGRIGMELELAAEGHGPIGVPLFPPAP